MRLPSSLHMAGVHRGLLENLAPTRRTGDGTSRTLTREEVEIWIDELCAGLIIPTAFRLNYLSSLKAASHSGHYAALLASLAPRDRRS